MIKAENFRKRCHLYFPEVRSSDLPTSNLLLKIEAPGLDDNELTEIVKSLRADIETLEVDSVAPATSGDIPKGAMAADWFEIGTLSIKMATVVLPPLILAVKSWLDRQSEGRKNTTAKEEWKIKLGCGSAFIEFGKSTTKQEVVEKGDQLKKQIESK